MRNLNSSKYLKGNWPLNSHTNDVSGYGNNGTPSNLTYGMTNKGKTCGVFNGSNSKVDIGDIGTDFMSCSLWFKPDSDIQASSTARVLLNIGARDSANYFHLATGGATSLLGNELIAVLDKDDNDQYRSGYCSSTDRIKAVPHHLVVVYTGDSTNFAIYLDGKRVDNSYSGSDAPLNSADDIIIGLRSDDQQPFDGQIWGVEFFNVKLTGDEVKRLYKQSIPNQISVSQPISQRAPYQNGNLIGAWGFNNGLGVQDSSGMGNDGTNNGVSIAKNGEFIFDGSSTVTHSSISTTAVCYWYENDHYYNSGTTYYKNGESTTSFTVLSTATTIGSGITGKIREVMHFSSALSLTEVKMIVNNGVPDDSLVLSVFDGTKDLSKNNIKLNNNNGVITGKNIKNDTTASSSTKLTTEVISNDIFDFSEDWSINIWAKIDNATSTRYFFAYGNGAVNPWVNIAINAQVTSGDVRVSSYTGNSYSTTLTGKSILNKWGCIGISYDSATNTQRIYYNGEYQTSLSPDYPQRTDSYRIFTINCRQASGTFIGETKDVKVFDEKKSDEWFKDYYNQTKKYY